MVLNRLAGDEMRLWPAQQVLLQPLLLLLRQLLEQHLLQDLS